MNIDANSVSLQLSKFKNSRILMTFREKSRVNPRIPRPTKSEWKELVRHFSRSLPFVYSSWGRDAVLSPYELRVCILLLSDFNIADIEILLATSPQSLTNIKSKANKKLFGEKSASTLENNLMNAIYKFSQAQTV